jgi:hypothetical protein
MQTPSRSGVNRAARSRFLQSGSRQRARAQRRYRRPRGADRRMPARRRLSSGAGQQYGFEKFIEYNRQLGEYSERSIPFRHRHHSRLVTTSLRGSVRGPRPRRSGRQTQAHKQNPQRLPDCRLHRQRGSERHQRHLLVSQRVKDTLEELHRSDRTRCRELALGGHSR